MRNVTHIVRTPLRSNVVFMENLRWIPCLEMLGNANTFLFLFLYCAHVFSKIFFFAFENKRALAQNYQSTYSTCLTCHSCMYCGCKQTTKEKQSARNSVDTWAGCHTPICSALCTLHIVMDEYFCILDIGHLAALHIYTQALPSGYELIGFRFLLKIISSAFVSIAP